MNEQTPVEDDLSRKLTDARTRPSGTVRLLRYVIAAGVVLFWCTTAVVGYLVGH